MKVCTQCKLAALCLGGANMYFMPSYEPMSPTPPYKRVALRVEVLPGNYWVTARKVFAMSNDCPRGFPLLPEGG